MMTYWETQYEALGAVIPDLPQDQPCEIVNPSLWALWRRIDPTVKPHPLLTEAEIMQRLDMGVEP